MPRKITPRHAKLTPSQKCAKASLKAFGCSSDVKAKRPKHPVNLNDFMWHTSDNHMILQHSWTNADCDEVRAKRIWNDKGTKTGRTVSNKVNMSNMPKKLDTSIIGAGIRPDTFFVKLTAADRADWYHDHVGMIVEVESKPIKLTVGLSYVVANHAWLGNTIRARDCIWYAKAQPPVKGAKKAHGVQAGPHAFTEFIKRPYILDEKKDDFNWLTDGSHGEGLPHSASKALKKAVDNWDPLAEAERKEKELEELGKIAREAAETVNKNIRISTDKRLDPTIYNLHKEEEAKRMAQSREQAGCCPKEVRKNGPIQEQFEELKKSLCVASEMLGRLENKLQPVRYVPPRPASEDRKVAERSGIFNELSIATDRVNDLCRRIAYLEEEIEL